MATGAFSDAGGPEFCSGDQRGLTPETRRLVEALAAIGTGIEGGSRLIGARDMVRLGLGHWLDGQLAVVAGLWTPFCVTEIDGLTGGDGCVRERGGRRGMGGGYDALKGTNQVPKPN
jgi:hypothetical protein